MPQFFSLNLINIVNIYCWNIDIYNDFVIFIELIIGTRTLVFIIARFISNNWIQTVSHWIALELIWTLFPALILIFLGVPSLKMLYIIEIFNFSSYLSLKVVGHQWYWEYNFSEFIINLISYPKLFTTYFRIGEAINLILPINCKIRVLVTSYDVIHSWSLPSIGLKIDACPGRLNFFIIIANQPGVYIGQCRELCGRYHSWIPILLEITSIAIYFEWVKIQI